MSNRIPDSYIEELIGRLDIVEVLSSYLSLKKAGAHYSARCPFHQEKTPSFIVNPVKQFYHCFGCGAHGDVLRFVMEQEGLGFVDAVHTLSSQLGMEVPVSEVSSEPSLEPVYRILKAARDFFVRNLEETPKAKEYLKARGLSVETIQRFNIGYAKAGWDVLKKALGKNPEQEALLEQAGLIVSAEGQSYDRFRDRVLFPIQDSRGRVLGFGGRILGQGQPKYLNSPQTAVFHKGSLLFGLDLLGKQKNLQELLVVEGYMDTVMLYQAGLGGVLASLGTAVTTEQLKALFKHHSQLVFCFDGDEAGFAAAQKTMYTLLPWMQDGRSVRFMVLPEGSDPDTFVRKEGLVGFQQLLREAIPFSVFFFRELRKTVLPTTIDNRAKFVQLAKKGLSELPRGVFRELMFRQLAEIVGTEQGVLETKRRAWRAPASLQKQSLMQPPDLASLAMGLLQRSPDLVIQQEHLLWLEQTLDPALQKLLSRIRSVKQGGGAFLQEREQVQEEEAFVSFIPDNGLQTVLEDTLKKLREQSFKKELDNLLVLSKSRSLTETERQRLKVLLKKSITR